jgi:hypothetical protein
MTQRTWILIAVAVVIVIAIYLFVGSGGEEATETAPPATEGEAPAEPAN